ncbi:MAG: hypothetical protein Q8R79_01025 [Legionellaceae bacterium]|nr:hypothetical protein [Legionellaceae bacterium]
MKKSNRMHVGAAGAGIFDGCHIAPLATKARPALTGRKAFNPTFFSAGIFDGLALTSSELKSLQTGASQQAASSQSGPTTLSKL